MASSCCVRPRAGAKPACTFMGRGRVGGGRGALRPVKMVCTLGKRGWGEPGLRARVWQKEEKGGLREQSRQVAVPGCMSRLLRGHRAAVQQARGSKLARLGPDVRSRNGSEHGTCE